MAEYIKCKMSNVFEAVKGNVSNVFVITVHLFQHISVNNVNRYV